MDRVALGALASADGRIRPRASPRAGGGRSTCPQLGSGVDTGAEQRVSSVSAGRMNHGRAREGGYCRRAERLALSRTECRTQSEAGAREGARGGTGARRGDGPAARPGAGGQPAAALCEQLSARTRRRAGRLRGVRAVHQHVAHVRVGRVRVEVQVVAVVPTTNRPASATGANIAARVPTTTPTPPRSTASQRRYRSAGPRPAINAPTASSPSNATTGRCSAAPPSEAGARDGCAGRNRSEAWIRAARCELGPGVIVVAGKGTVAVYGVG